MRRILSYPGETSILVGGVTTMIYYATEILSTRKEPTDASIVFVLLLTTTCVYIVMKVTQAIVEKYKWEG